MRLHATATACAREVEAQLRGDHYAEFIANVYGNSPNQWDPKLNNPDRSRAIVNAFTRMRFCDSQGRMDFNYKGLPGDQEKHLLAWFDVPRASWDLNIVFGHWSALGLIHSTNLLGLDTGCLWGGKLTAARLDADRPELYSVDCEAKRKIK